MHKIYALLIMTLVVKKADIILTGSEWTSDQISRRWPFSKLKIKTIYNGIKMPVKGCINKEVINKYNIDKPYILYLGLLKKHKNLANLIEAFVNAQSDLRGEYLLIIAGDLKSDETDLPSLINKKKQNKSIRLLGFVPGEDLPGLYSGASVFAFPSLSEGFGLPPLEAMSHGVPVISSNATCLPEVLKTAPMYFNPLSIADISKCIKRAIGNEKWRSDASIIGKEIASSYSWERTVEGCIRLYKSLLNN